jgi:hypothetical protein
MTRHSKQELRSAVFVASTLAILVKRKIDFVMTDEQA